MHVISPPYKSIIYVKASYTKKYNYTVVVLLINEFGSDNFFIFLIVRQNDTVYNMKPIMNKYNRSVNSGSPSRTLWAAIMAGTSLWK